MFSPYAERVAADVETGRQLKYYNGKGKEYYAVYVGYRSDAFLDLVSDKIDQLYPAARQGAWISVPGVIFKLYDTCPQMFQRIGDSMYIHKAKFRKHLRRALSKARVKNQK